MRLNDELEFIRALPEAGAAVLTHDRDERGRLRAAIEEAAGHAAADRVVILIATREEQMKLVRSKTFDGAHCWPKITASMLADQDRAVTFAQAVAVGGVGTSSGLAPGPATRAA